MESNAHNGINNLIYFIMLVGQAIASLQIHTF